MLSLLQMVAGKPWAIRGDMAAHVHGMVKRDGIAGLRHLAEFKAKVHAFDDDDGGAPSVNAMRPRVLGSVGVVSVLQVLTARGDIVGSAETRSTMAVARDVAALAGDSRIDAIVLELDSPGGEVSYIPEAYGVIAAAAKVKPVVAVTNGQEASATLYLGAGATEKFVTPSGQIGSLGVYILHVDESKALDNEGLAFEFIVADGSPYKVEGNSTGPLSEEARAHLQKWVNHYMGMFVRDVAKGRHVSTGHVLKHFGQGRMLSAEEAVAAKLADTVGTLEQAVRRAEQLGAAARRGRTSAPRAAFDMGAPSATHECSRCAAGEAGTHADPSATFSPHEPQEPADAPPVEPAPAVGLTPAQALARKRAL